MATTKFYLDTRAATKGKPSPLKIAITRKSKTALFSTGISLLPEQWDKNSAVISAHPNKKYLNTFIAKRKIEVDTVIPDLVLSGEISKMSVGDIKQKVVSALLGDNEPNAEDNFVNRFKAFSDRKTKNSAKSIYEHTLNRIRAFCAEKNTQADRLTFDEITKEWLLDFNVFLANLSLLGGNANREMTKCRNCSSPIALKPMWS